MTSLLRRAPHGAAAVPAAGTPATAAVGASGVALMMMMMMIAMSRSALGMIKNGGHYVICVSALDDSAQIDESCNNPMQFDIQHPGQAMASRLGGLVLWVGRLSVRTRLAGILS